MKTNRSLAVVLLVVSSLIISCSIGLNNDNQTTSNSHSSKQVDPGLLRLNLPRDPVTADPSLVEDTTSGILVRALFDGLMRRGKDGNPHEAVAESYEVSADGLTYTFRLRNTKWSNGDPVTARDFEFSWKRMIDPKTASSFAYQMYCIKNAELANKGKIGIDHVGVRALDDYTLQVELEYPTPFFLELVSFHSYYPVHPGVVHANPQWALDAKSHVSNGPFTLQVWEHQNRVVLIKNPLYWDASEVRLQRIIFSLENNPTTELTMFENGELDWAGAPLHELPFESYDRLSKSGKLVTYPIAGTYWYKFNTNQPPFQNAKIRKAFAYAINRQEICDSIDSGKKPATGVVPPSMSLTEAGYFKDNDAENAKKLLREGMAELQITKLPPITLSYNTSASHKKIAEVIQKQWKEVLGVEVTLHDEEWSTYMSDLHTGNFQIGRMGWLADYHDPINFLELFKEQTTANNDTNWENKQYKDLLTQSTRTKDNNKRKELLTQAEQILMDEMPVLPIFFYTNSYVKDDSVKDVLVDGLGYIDWKWAYREN